MEKDIDDLLDEVESKYVNRSRKTESKPKSENVSTASNSNSNSNPNPKPKSQHKQRNTVDDAISDILDLDLDDDVATKKEASRTSMSTAVTSTSSSGRKDAAKKCFPIFLGGSSDETGLGTTVKTRACDQLRCTDCDFRVCYFDDFSWKKETHYLFLRNNVPDFQKLKSNLRRQKGCRAYCCQCNWKDVSALQEISDSKLKWVCGKHVL